MIGPGRAERIVAIVMTFVSTMPLPMVQATASHERAGEIEKRGQGDRLAGRQHLVDTTVAMALAAS